MDKAIITLLIDEIKNYTSKDTRIMEPYLYLFAKKKGELIPDNIVTKDIALTKDEDFSAIKNILSEYCETLLLFMNNDPELNDINESDKKGDLWYKVMDTNELQFTENLQSSPDDKVEFGDFLKPKYDKRFLFIEIPLEENKKIILFKQIKGNKYNVKKKFVVNPYEEKEHVKILNSQRDILLDDNFEIVAYYHKFDKSNSFFFIKDRDLFEDFFNYHKKYKESFGKLQEELDIIDWSIIKETTPLLRQSYSLINFTQFKECKAKVEQNLISTEENKTKKALKSKGIKCQVNDGKLKVNIENTNQLKTFLKIIKDGVATTDILGRDGLAGDFEEIKIG